MYVPIENIENGADRVKCTFTATSFDLSIEEFEGKSYRLFIEVCAFFWIHFYSEFEWKN